MKRIILFICLVLTASCASRPVQYIVPAPALREIFRGGQLQGLEQNTGQYLGMPDAYDRVEHSCHSMPVYNMYGQYVTTSVRCN